ncbi:hypothetical protein BR93DRAFT_800504 [Coniochaeta sp. PMI_546]|nr:hypothetical protein BR93DRAFT_800504 [Coniochaeta sp. PMI_546]
MEMSASRRQTRGYLLRDSTSTVQQPLCHFTDVLRHPGGTASHSRVFGLDSFFLLVAHSLGGYKLARPGAAERYMGTPLLPLGNNLGTSTLLPARPRPLPATQNKMAGWTPRFTLARAYGNPSDPSTLSVPHPPSWPGSQSFLSFLWLCLLFYKSTLAISVISPPLRS